MGVFSVSYAPSSLSLYCCNNCYSISRSSQVVCVIPRTWGVVKDKSRTNLRCNSSHGTGGPSSPGENENKTVLDAFFLGKALSEAINERIESTVGEFFSTIGRLQAEQQKQVQDFQEEVLERAKRSKEKAAREAMEVQNAIPESSTTNLSKVDPTAAPSGGNAPALSVTPSDESAVDSDVDQNTTSTNTVLDD